MERRETRRKEAKRVTWKEGETVFEKAASIFFLPSLYCAPISIN